MYVCRDDTGDALGIMRRQSGEGQVVGQQGLSNVAYACTGFKGHLLFSQIFVDNAAVFVQRDKGVITLDAGVEGVGRAKHTHAISIFYKFNNFCFGSGLGKMSRLVIKAFGPIPERAAAYTPFQINVTAKCEGV